MKTLFVSVGIGLLWGCFGLSHGYQSIEIEKDGLLFFFLLLNSDYSQMLEGAKHVLTKTSIAPQPCACLLAGVECGNCQKAKQPQTYFQ